MKENTLEGVKRIVGVVAGKGGVGKSTVAAHLALALKRRGLKVGVLDADIYGPSMRLLLNEEAPPGQEGDHVVPARASGMPIISVAYFRSGEAPSVVRAPIANQIIKQFLESVLWGELDYLIVDFPPGTGDIQITLMQLARFSGVVVVTTPQELSLLDVRKSIQMVQAAEVSLLGVIENMSFFRNPETGENPYMGTV